MSYIPNMMREKRDTNRIGWPGEEMGGVCSYVRSVTQKEGVRRHFILCVSTHTHTVKGEYTLFALKTKKLLSIYNAITSLISTFIIRRKKPRD